MGSLLRIVSWVWMQKCQNHLKWGGIEKSFMELRVVPHLGSPQAAQ